MTVDIISDPNTSDEEKFARLHYTLMRRGIDSFIMNAPTAIAICHGYTMAFSTFTKIFETDDPDEEFYNSVEGAAKVGLYKIQKTDDGKTAMRFGIVTKDDIRRAEKDSSHRWFNEYRHPDEQPENINPYYEEEH